MPIGTRLEKLLLRSHTEYARSIHPRAYTARQVAFEEEISPHRVAKAVVYKGDKGFGMAVVPADALLDLPELQFVLQWSHIRLATEDELRLLFPDCEVGAMPPFGNLVWTSGGGRRRSRRDGCNRLQRRHSSGCRLHALCGFRAARPSTDLFLLSTESRRASRRAAGYGDSVRT